MSKWTNARETLPAPARKHSMNQKVMKRNADLERKFTRMQMRRVDAAQRVR